MTDIIAIAPAPGLPDIALVPSVSPAVALTADDPIALAAFGAPQWGVFLGGVPVIVADTVLDLGYVKPYAISDYPIEGGSFASYDKVELPYEARVRFASGGSPAARAALIASVEAIVGDLNLYDVATPDQVYINANVVREEYRRTQSDGGGSLLMMDVGLQEVRILADDTDASNASDPSSANQQNNGTVQPQPATPGQMTSALTPVTTPPPTLGGGISGLPVSQAPNAGGIGSA